MEQATLKGKLIITATLRLITGMHIGASNDFAPIGAVDSVFVRDPYTKQPVIPGSSQKGKLRTLLARARTKGYVLHKIDSDDFVLKRLFGSAGQNNVKPARLQFYDIFMTEDSVTKVNSLDMDTYLGEIKFENTINRLDSVANPRQIERVPAGSEFALKLVYNVEKASEVEEDMKALAEGFSLLQLDYLGGHGSRGYGRVALENFDVQEFTLDSDEMRNIDLNKIKEVFEGCRLI
jgi:CRISPR-associated protein Csm3